MLSKVCARRSGHTFGGWQGVRGIVHLPLLQRELSASVAILAITHKPRKRGHWQHEAPLPKIGRVGHLEVELHDNPTSRLQDNRDIIQLVLGRNADATRAMEDSERGVCVYNANVMEIQSERSPYIGFM